MSTIRITKEFSFEGAHSLMGYDGKCRHIHGHSYKLYVTLKGRPTHDLSSPKNGMMMDFKDLKNIVNQHIIDIYDHALLLQEGYPLSKELKEAYGNIVILPFRPTCENLISHIANILQPLLPQNITLHSLRFHETSSSYVEWFAEDNK